MVNRRRVSIALRIKPDLLSVVDQEASTRSRREGFRVTRSRVLEDLVATALRREPSRG